MPDISEPRELTPVQKFWGGGKGFKDLSPHIEKIDAEEVAEAEEAMTPAPKDFSAPASAASVELPPPTAPVRSETPALPAATTEQQENSSGADSGCGKPSGSREDEPSTSSQTKPAPESSSSSSSSETSPGKSTPPAAVKPPIVVSPPADPTTQT